MLWSLIKILAFVAAVTGLTYGAIDLAEMSGNARITLFGIEVTLTPLEMVFALGGLVLLVWLGLKIVGLLYAVFKFLNGDETAVSRYFTRNRERRGFEALSEGMLALASGEGHLALAKATKAERFLERPELTTILTAQAAELAGDGKRAEEAYKRLLADNSTRFVGIRGLMQQKLAQGDTETALKLAEKAFQIKPKHVETQDTLLKLQADKGDWAGARATLAAKLKAGSLPRDIHKRRDAVLALSEAQGILDEGATIEAREAAVEANRQSPDLVPAAVMAARGYIANDDARSASRILTKAWAARPHPDLAATFADIVPDETAQARIKRFRALTKSTADHPETRMLLAELHIAAEDFPEARRALGDLVKDDPDARVLTLLAAIEKGSGADEATVRQTLARALNAPRASQWVCEKCHSPHAEWAPICGSCGAFDTLSWSKPQATGTAGVRSTDLRPLIATPSEALEETSIVVGESSTDEDGK